MKDISELTSILNKHFNWDKRRIKCFANMLLALVLGQTVNLIKIASLIVGEIKMESQYRKLQRFFSGFNFNYDLVAGFIYKLFKFDDQKIYLVLDRTQWRWGKQEINILMLGIVWNNCAIPIYWLLLKHRGNSATRHRTALLKRFINNFGKENILGILGDREFYGKEWFKYLDEQDIAFYIRIKKDTEITTPRGFVARIEWLVKGLKKRNPVVFSKGCKIYGMQINVCAVKLENNDYLIIVSNKDIDKGIEIYSLRWRIESLFGFLKSKGFNLEDTHMTKGSRIKKLLTLLAIAFCWAYKAGEWQVKNVGAIPIKKHKRPASSIFRCGLIFLKQAIINLLTTRASRLSRLIQSFLQPILPTNPLSRRVAAF